MQTKIAGVLFVLMACLPMAFAGENVALEVVSVSPVQKSSRDLNFRSHSDFISNPESGLRGSRQSGEGMALPYLIAMPKSIPYPRWARREGFQGRLVISLEILKNGNVGRWRIEQSTGDAKLDQNAADAILTWKFHPAMQKGKPVTTCIEVPVNFELIRD